MFGKKRYKELGNLGEDMACHYLLQKGYKIIDRNIRNKIGEIDIVAKDAEDVYVFIEVKTRKSVDYGLPLEAINYRKQNKIKNTAIFYLKHKNLYDKVSIRFDCISIIGAYESYQIEHLENIF